MEAQSHTVSLTHVSGHIHSKKVILTPYWIYIVRQVLEQRGMCPEIALELEGRMRDLGLENIKQRTVSLPLGDKSKISELSWYVHCL